MSSIKKLPASLLRVINWTYFISFPFIIMSSFLQNIISGPKKERQVGFFFNMCFENNVKSWRYKKSTQRLCLDVPAWTPNHQDPSIRGVPSDTASPLLNCRQMQPSWAFCVVHTQNSLVNVLIVITTLFLWAKRLCYQKLSLKLNSTSSSNCLLPTFFLIN